MIYCLGRYVDGDQDMPDRNLLDPAGCMAYLMMQKKVDRALTRYAKKCRNMREAAVAREQKKKNEAQNPQLSQLWPTEQEQERNKEQRTEGSSRTDFINDDDLQKVMADQEKAQDLILEYKLPNSPASMDALLDDAAAHGWQRV